MKTSYGCLAVVAILAFIVGVVYVETLLFHWVWNYFADSTSLPHISKWMAFVIIFLLSSIFGAKARSK